ncbi:MAG: FAD-dependent oxidoreductase, partial [Actinomycetota bacterium]|nr:FAD-dependent oxidoreductase [Actinomycetota bacterium]
VTERERADVVVGGAGIAGLSAAWELRDRDVRVLEATNRIGGRLMSARRDPYWLNFGGHVIGGPETETGRLLQATGVESVELPGVLSGLVMNGRLIAGGRVETYPFRVPLALRDRLGLIRVGVRLRLAVADYGRVSRLRPGESEAERRARVLAYRDDATFAEFLGRTSRDVDEMFRATIRRSSGEPEEVSAGYGIGYFQLVWDRSKGLSRNIIGGSSTLPSAIARELGDRVVTGSTVDRVTRTDDRVRVEFVRDGVVQTITARAVVVAAPAYAARRMIADLPGDVAAALDRISYGPYVVGSFLTSETRAMSYDNVYAAATPKASFNMLFNLANALRRGGRRDRGGSLMVYAAANLARDLWDRSDAEVERRFLDDLYERFPDLRGNVREAVIRRWELGVPHPRPGRHLLQPALEQPLGNVFLAGDYLGTTYIETSIETGAAAARAARRTLDASVSPGPGK